MEALCHQIPNALSVPPARSGSIERPFGGSTAAPSFVHGGLWQGFVDRLFSASSGQVLGKFLGKFLASLWQARGTPMGTKGDQEDSRAPRIDPRMEPK